MIIYLFSDKKYEYQAHACLKSFEHKLTDDIKVVYFTVGFDSDITTKNLIKVRVPINLIYPGFTYYKPELALKLMKMFPTESDFLFTDVDVLFTHRMDFKQFVHNYDYPLAIYLTHEFTFKYKKENNEITYATEENLMKYFNLQKRSMRYQGSGFFAFNRNCIDFLKEWTSICKNEYLLEKQEIYFPFTDETAMNICLWKRNATQSLGHIFVNTLKFESIKLIEESNINHTFLGKNIDDYGSDTEYVHDFDKIMFYHGIRDVVELEKSLNYLLPKTTMKDTLVYQYTSTKQLNKPTRPNIRLSCTDGMFVEILGSIPKKYDVKFINKNTNTVEFQLVLQTNHWAKTAIKYYVPWKIEVTDLETEHTFEYELELEKNKVFIALDSKSLGDTLAWVPYADEFRKKYNCQVVCSTFWNDMFRSEYPDITFVEPGEMVYNLTAMYKIGFFYNEDGSPNLHMNPSPAHQNPLQKTASDILGLDFQEIRPRIKQPTVTSTEKQVTIAVHSTTQAKYWNNPTGWQGVVDWLNAKGYTVKLLSKEGDGYMGNPNPHGVVVHPRGPIQNVMQELKNSKMFIGLGSGLSWLSWALNVPTMVISGFSDPISEMQDCIRITAPKGSCSGCFNRVRLDAGDWHWCPDHKNTPRQYECSADITPEMVIAELQKVL
jgi:autotransporter strand-loop-strand O-heptosyltransferase